jgi:predicted TIM-barrel fold metal-dependent hydrolase
MTKSIKGKCKFSVRGQASVTNDMCNKFPGRLLPFVCMNPRNPDMKSLFAETLMVDSNFWGVKTYPNLGYLPSNPQLMEIFEYCESHRIPIVTHCSSGAVHTTDKHLTDIPRTEIVDGKYVTKKESKWFFKGNDYANYFSNPKNWEVVLTKYPNLVINFGHFGGFEQWKDYIAGKDNTWVSRIINYMHRFPNVYADISYTLHDRNVVSKIKDLIAHNELIRSRVLFGTDFYMVTMEGRMRSIITDFYTIMGPDLMDIISKQNPRKFLFE